MNDPIRDRLADVRRRIKAAAEASDRNPDSVTLIAVGKTFSAAKVAEAVVAGATDLGEIRVQEASEKKPEVPPARWHLIGPLQRNKAKRALELFDVIHTVDRAEIAQRLQYLLEQHWPERTLPVLIEINLGGEPQKAGAEPQGAGQLLSEVLAFDRLEAAGLMAIPPYETDPEATRKHFRALHDLRDRLQSRFGIALPELSMGMSQDFETAVSEGATMVRVGTAIFGPRR